jgi:hypothetical protein
MQPKDEVCAKRAILCRKIRLWLAANPNSTTGAVMKQFSLADDSPLMKMEYMGIIACDTTGGSDMARAKWRVVPQ